MPEPAQAVRRQVIGCFGCNLGRLLLLRQSAAELIQFMMRLAFLCNKSCLAHLHPVRQTCAAPHQPLLRPHWRLMSTPAAAGSSAGTSGQALAQKKCEPCEGGGGASLSRQEADAMLAQARPELQLP